MPLFGPSKSRVQLCTSLVLSVLSVLSVHCAELCCPGHVLFQLFLEVPRSSSRQHVENCSITTFAKKMWYTVWGQNHKPKTVRFGLIPECLHSSSPDLLLHKLRKLSSSSFILCFWVPFWAGLCWKPWKKSLEKARQMTVDLDQ